MRTTNSSPSLFSASQSWSTYSQPPTPQFISWVALIKEAGLRFEEVMPLVILKVRDTSKSKPLCLVHLG